MVAYLHKPEGSEDFQQIVDLLNTSHIKFALTKNPTIDTSLIQQFWQTASTSTLEDGEVEITATIDGQLKTITEASLRRHLKLEDADGPIQQDEGSTVPVESHHTPITTPSTSQPPLSSPFRVPTPPHDSPLPGGHTPGSDEGSMTLNELTVLCTQLSTKVASLEQDLKQTKKVYGNAYTKLIMRVKKLEHKVKSRQPRRRARVVISDTKEDLEDPSKQGRRIVEIDQNPSISLVQDEGTSWIQEDAEIQGRTSADTEILLDQEEPTELVEDLGSGEKGEKEISTASATPEVSTAAKNLVYIRRSAEKRKDKGKAIMKEDESVYKKDAEIAKQLQEEFDRARQEQEVVAKVDQAHDIDWSDPAVLRYHALQNRSFSIAEVRKNMCIVWDQNHAFVPNDSEIEKEVMKRPGFDFQQKSIKKNDKIKASGFVQKQPAEEEKEKKNDDKDDAEKEELRDNMDVVPIDDIAIDVESLATKYPIVDWKTHVLTENMMYYQIIRADGSSKNYKIFSEMLDDFDRQDVMDLHRLVQERKKYPLTQEMLSRMLSRRLEVDQESEMVFELLRLDQNRYPVDTSLIHIESLKLSTAVLFDVNTRRIFIRHLLTHALVNIIPIFSFNSISYLRPAISNYEIALVAQDRIRGYDWSYQAKEEHPTNFALMAHTSSGSSSNSDSEVDSCSKSCVKAYATLKEQYDSLSSDYKKSQFNLVSYKEVKLRDDALVENKKKLEKAEKERDELKLTLEKFQNSSKSLNNLLESQVVDKFKTGLGYNAASSTAASPAVERNFISRKPDLTFMDEIVKSENMNVTTIITPSNVKTVKSNHESAGVQSNSDAIEPKTVRKNSFRPPVIEDWNFDDESEVEIIPKDKTVSSSTEKIKFVKTARETVEKVETSKQNKHYPRGNKRNWNNLMSQRLGSNFKMINKACFICGSFEHLHYVCNKKVIRLVWNNSSRVNHKNFANKMTHPHHNRRFVPQAVLTKSGKINIVGTSVNTAVRRVNIAGSKPIVNHPKPISNAYKKGYSQVTRTFNKYSE
ncbi:hypothetical protein Tco_0144266 [Tanacetum coccineum]